MDEGEFRFVSGRISFSYDISKGTYEDQNHKRVSQARENSQKYKRSVAIHRSRVHMYPRNRRGRLDILLFGLRVRWVDGLPHLRYLYLSLALLQKPNGANIKEFRTRRNNDCYLKIAVAPCEINFPEIKI